MRLSSLAPLALFALVLEPSPAMAQALPLSDSLVVGFWDFNDDDFPQPDSSDTKIRLAAFFTPNHAFEVGLWMQSDPLTTKPEDVHKAMRMTGTWFVRDTLLGMTYTTCTGLTESGRRECESDQDEQLDTGYLTLENQELRFFGLSRIMAPVDGWRLPLWRYEGPVRDMSTPAFWEGPALSLSRERRSLPASLDPAAAGRPAFDVLGRRPAVRGPTVRGPIKLFARPHPVPSGQG
jgi:hypothetical protein